MKTNILFLVNYDQSDYMCSSINYSLGYSKEMPHIISFFENKLNKQIYANYFNIEKNLKFYNNNENLKEILHVYLTKYEWVIILCPESLYHDGYVQEVTKFCDKHKDLKEFAITHKNNEKITRSIAIHRTLLQHHLSQQLQINDIEAIYRSKKLLEDISFQATPLSNVINNTSVIYEDKNCIFAKFSSVKSIELVDSFIYINKNNNKIYNIDNNIIGHLLDRTGNKIVIEWQLNDSKKQILHYAYNDALKIYINI